MLSVCCINFSTMAGDAGGTEEEGPTAELAHRSHSVPNTAAAAFVCPHVHHCSPALLSVRHVDNPSDSSAPPPADD